MSLPAGWLTEAQRRELSDCRQGDVVFIPRQVWLASGELPSTEYSKEHAAGKGLAAIHESAPHGLAILTQTCDLVPRSDRDRPFVAVAPVVELSDSEAAQASRGRMPRYAHLPAFRNGCYFVDLDRITTVETGLLLLHQRNTGLGDDTQRKVFSQAIGRKFGRFAFPDDLPRAMSKWRDHVVSKYGRENSQEGALYRSAVDVRVSADPSWEADESDITVTVLFPPGFLPGLDPDAEPDIGTVEQVAAQQASEIAERLQKGVAQPELGALMCARLAELWSQRCECVGSVASVTFELVSTDEMTVDEYLRSFSFDLEFLSPG